MLRHFATAAVVGAGLTFGAFTATYAADMAAHVKAAVSDASRPAADTARDADRKPGAILAFIGVKAGDKVADFFPGDGYFTRLYAKTVGANGKVFAVVPEEMLARNPKATDAVSAIAADAGYKNVAVATASVKMFKVPEPVDVVWVRQNYHDLHNKGFGVDIAAFNKSVYDSLKPGGLFVILDHVSAAGTDFDEQAHRISADRVKKEVVAAGFKLAGESDVLKNPADDGTKGVFDASVRGKTNQFILKFQK